MAPHSNEEATSHAAPVEIKLTTISAAGLLNGDKQTQNDLFEACKALGFFYLDCRDHPSASTTSLIERVSQMALDFYDLPLPSKEDWAELSFDGVKSRPFALVLTPSLFVHSALLRSLLIFRQDTSPRVSRKVR